MTSFTFGDTHELFRREVRNFAERELLPEAGQRAKQDFVSMDILKKMAHMGLLGINVPEEYGGQQLDWISLGIAVEEIGRVNPIEGLLPTLVHESFGAISQNKQLCDQWIPQLVGGDILIAFAMTEPDAGADAAAITTRATRQDDHYILNGEKTPVSMGSQASIAILFAKTDPDQGAKGTTCFLIPLPFPGVSLSTYDQTGFHAFKSASMIFDEAKLPARFRLGEEGKGFYYAMEAFDLVRISMALSCLGAAGATLDETIQYAKQRVAFKKPIGSFQGISFKLAEAATLLEAARMLCYKALGMRDRGLPHTKESAMCKWWAPKIAVQIIYDCLLIHGHVGYSKESPIEQRLRDAIGFQIADGTAEIQKLIIARELLGKL